MECGDLAGRGVIRSSLIRVGFRNLVGQRGWTSLSLNPFGGFVPTVLLGLFCEILCHLADKAAARNLDANDCVWRDGDLCTLCLQAMDFMKGRSQLPRQMRFVPYDLCQRLFVEERSDRLEAIDSCLCVGLQAFSMRYRVNVILAGGGRRSPNELIHRSRGGPSTRGSPERPRNSDGTPREQPASNRTKRAGNRMG
jgi:hypothetical protein